MERRQRGALIESVRRQGDEREGKTFKKLKEMQESRNAEMLKLSMNPNST